MSRCAPPENAAARPGGRLALGSPSSSRTAGSCGTASRRRGSSTSSASLLNRLYGARAVAVAGSSPCPPSVNVVMPAALSRCTVGGRAAAGHQGRPSAACTMPMSVARIERTGPDVAGDAGRRTTGQPGDAALDELLGDHVGLAEADLRAAAAGVVDLHDHRPGASGSRPWRAARSAATPLDREALGGLLGVRLVVGGLVVVVVAAPGDASAATRASAERRRRGSVRATGITTECIDAGGIAPCGQA